MSDDLLERFTAIVSDDSAMAEQTEEASADAPEGEPVGELEESAETEVEAVESLEGVESEGLEFESVDTEEDFLYEIGGKEYSASEIESWKDNGLRQSDYTKKTQELASDRRGWDTEKAQLKTELESTISKVRELAKVTADFEVGDDGLPLYDEDMPKYQRVKAQQDKIDAILGEAATLTNNAPSPEVIAKEQAKLLELVPEWSDAEVQGKEAKMMADLVSELGLGEDFSKEYRASMYSLVRLAAIGQNALKSGSEIEKQVVKAPRIVKPKQAKQSAKRTQLQEAKDRFRKSGGSDRKAGVELFKQFV